MKNILKLAAVLVVSAFAFIACSKSEDMSSPPATSTNAPAASTNAPAAH